MSAIPAQLAHFAVGIYLKNMVPQPTSDRARVPLALPVLIVDGTIIDRQRMWKMQLACYLETFGKRIRDLKCKDVARRAQIEFAQ
jgi:hypothetical protein